MKCIRTLNCACYFFMKRRIRFLNFIIDSLVFLVIVVSASFVFRNLVEQDDMKIYSIVFYCAYYFLFELLSGRTIGKMITGTKVVDKASKEDPSFIQILLRTLSRLIPVDYISYLFRSNGIHDYLSSTQLIKQDEL